MLRGTRFLLYLAVAAAILSAGCGHGTLNGWPVVKDQDDAVRWLAYAAQQKQASQQAQTQGGLPAGAVVMSGQEFYGVLVKFMADKGRWPNSLDELKTSGYVESIPAGISNYNPADGTFSVVVDHQIQM